MSTALWFPIFCLVHARFAPTGHMTFFHFKSPSKAAGPTPAAPQQGSSGGFAFSEAKLSQGDITLCRKASGTLRHRRLHRRPQPCAAQQGFPKPVQNRRSAPRSFQQGIIKSPAHPDVFGHPRHEPFANHNPQNRLLQSKANDRGIELGNLRMPFGNPRILGFQDQNLIAEGHQISLTPAGTIGICEAPPNPFLEGRTASLG